MSFIKIQMPTSLFGRCSIQQRALHPLTQKALFALTGMRPLSSEEKGQMFERDQKLWVAHFSIRDHGATELHWSKFSAMQLANPTDFSTQRYYLGLLQKKKTTLTQEEALALVNLYEFALAQSPDRISRNGLNRKLTEYQAILKSS